MCQELCVIHFLAVGFLTWIRKIQNALHQCAESIRHAQERNRHQHMPVNDPVKVQAVVSFDDKTVTDSQAENDRYHATQQGIHKATWAAVVAASIYAFIA